MFEPVQRASVVDACVDALQRAIVAGDLPVGERLPPERDLAVRFGVNRTTLRMALRQVAAGGLLAVRQGSGHTVRDFRSSAGPDLVPAIVAAARDSGHLVGACAELLTIRRALAMAMLEALASHPPTTNGFAAIETAIDAMSNALHAGEPTAVVAQCDLAVASAFVAASGSTMLGLFINPIAQVLANLPLLVEAMFADPATNLSVWRSLASLVQNPVEPALLVAPMMQALQERDNATLRRLEALCSGS